MRTENDLRATLKGLEHDAPQLEDILLAEPNRDRHPGTHRHRSLLNVSAAVITVCGIAALVAVLLAGHHSARTGRPTPSMATELSSRTWLLASVEAGGISYKANSLVLEINTDGTFQQSLTVCASLAGSLTLHDDLLNFDTKEQAQSCPGNPLRSTVPSQPATIDQILKRVLVRETHWSLADGILVISKAETGVLTYHVGASNPPS